MLHPTYAVDLEVPIPIDLDERQKLGLAFHCLAVTMPS